MFCPVKSSYTAKVDAGILTGDFCYSTFPNRKKIHTTLEQVKSGVHLVTFASYRKITTAHPKGLAGLHPTLRPYLAPHRRRHFLSLFPSPFSLSVFFFILLPPPSFFLFNIYNF